MIGIFKHALMITGFVFVMMLVIEYLNVLSRGDWQQRLAGRNWGQYLLAAALGVTPGRLGAFAIVTMFTHRTVSLGAVVTTMIATSGDESFVMLAMIPRQAALIFTALFVVSIAAGALADMLADSRFLKGKVKLHTLKVHEEELCKCYPKGQILAQWKECSADRGVLVVVLVLLISALLAGEIGPPVWNWIRITLFAVSSVALFIVSTVPEHFLKTHLWDHVVRKHVPQIFFWTFGALIAMHVITETLALGQVIKEGRWIVLIVACLVGLIPESGPHLMFITLYVGGTIPLSILLASSIVQDGHGMLPLLAESRRSFLLVKAVNFVSGLGVGASLMVFGY